jgi:predicted phosphodiesterase
LADIHGDVERLAQLIARLRDQGADRFVVLGDIIYDTHNADETVSLLTACDAVGVWGNHELALCVEPDEEIRQMYSPTVMDYFAQLQPRLELGSVLLSHTFPTEDAREVLAFYVGRLDEFALIERCFAEFPHRVMICGHFHRWYAATPRGPLDWSGERPLLLAENERYFIVMGAVMKGAAAILDSERNVLIPIDLSA